MYFPSLLVISELGRDNYCCQIRLTFIQKCASESVAQSRPAFPTQQLLLSELQRGATAGANYQVMEQCEITYLTRSQITRQSGRVFIHRLKEFREG